ncbi:thioredoxin family protein [Hippea maritima]|uniref:Thioredoxin domain-containing protein n=1 Tax=Hippea maritima (strain ATCC 700847 / DSM 10411 / MH2) TaxID=760142 RepID=F2LUW1_HIPMA|nr:thioredoxin family protein [Hippea maritima]AEA33566.1 hypothetical protein Hipma_0596 [Hippea maritima DSM 10411]
MLRKLFFIFIVSALLFVYGCSKHPKKTIDIKSNGKPIVLIFDSTTCPYCIKLNKDLSTNALLKDYQNKMKFYFIHIDKDNYYTIKTSKGKLKLDTASLARMFGFRGSTPYVVITDANTKIILTIPGYVKPATMAKVLKYITTKAYQTMSINEYLSTP